MATTRITKRNRANVREMMRNQLTAKTCKWFLLCTNEATLTREHPILGSVDICKRCNDKIESFSVHQ